MRLLGKNLETYTLHLKETLKRIEGDKIKIINNNELLKLFNENLAPTKRLARNQIGYLFIKLGKEYKVYRRVLFKLGCTEYLFLMNG